ncbi:hypothetical protein JCM33374_g5096 [Metschnikowia sp. JCM 33374]|nr:hypothetical protein JCM33374_g5096 [Metschnikowia sp. JCM 33374]
MDITRAADDSQLQQIDPELKIIGYTNSGSGNDTDPKYVYLRFHPTSKLPFVDPRRYDRDRKFTVVLFSPPNLRNLEYFTVRPILLQSTNMVHDGVSYANKISLLHGEDKNPDCRLICNEGVLDKINGCSRIRSAIKSRRSSKPAYTAVTKSTLLDNQSQSLALIRKAILDVIIWIVGISISVVVCIISYLNTEVFGINPVKKSAWCRQLDLRLRQVSFFPFQFLSYYDTNFLKSDIQSQLGIPMTNERYNINNSNYINLYNTMWLIINDVLIGSTLHRFLSRDLDKKMHQLNDALFTICFTKLDTFISWIGSDYPGGFKLNNDLGQFMQLLFLWTSQTCSEVFRFLAFASSSENWFMYIIKAWLKVSCYLGVSFVTAFFIDYVKITNVHTHLFSLAATKIYNRQVEMLKSLMQLFRGRKYNVLRDRIDKIEEDQLRIDQLLLGTFVFLVLIYLLPTTFAFYCLFYAFRVTMCTCLKFGDKIILCFNLYPLFVVLLKLKNSRRLQGGVHFIHKGYHRTTDWFLMENKALTFDEIFGNFVHVFRQEGRCDRLFLNFAEGIDLQVKDTSAMKFQYLMLPANHTSLVKIWKERTDRN